MTYFAGKIAVVTGGGSGIGRALCVRLAELGAERVIVADINLAGAEETAGLVRSAGASTDARRVDVTKDEEVGALVGQVVGQQGRLDFFINNAGVALAGGVRDQSLDDLRRVMAVNFWGAVHGTKAAYEQMLLQGHGHIINVAAAAGLFPTPVAAAYSASKHAVIGLSTGLRMEAALHGVRVTVACPWFVDTGLFAAGVFRGVDQTRAIERLRTQVPMLKPATCAARILKGVARNRAVIPVGFLAVLTWQLYRLNPGAFIYFGGLIVRQLSKMRRPV